MSLEVMKRMELFDRVGEQDLRSIFELCRPMRVERGTVLFEIDSEGTELFIMLSGRVSIELATGASSRELVSFEREQRIFGELALIDGHRRSATVTAVDELELLCLRRHDLDALLEKNSHLGFVLMSNLSKVVAGKLRNTNQLLRNLLSQQQSLFKALNLS